MLDVLLVKIQPTDRYLTEKAHGFKPFPIEEPSDFEISVLNGDPMQFRASKIYYYCKTEAYKTRVAEINENLDVKHGGHVVAIDKYPFSRFKDGVKIEKGKTDTHCYEVECRSENINYDALILLVPSKEPIILSTLDFAYGGDFMKGLSPDFIGFFQNCVLSVTTPFGEVKGIALRKFNEYALTPEYSDLFYTMSFEKVSLPAVILQKLLETKPQPGSEPHEETHG